jgi:hypothetical protein
MNIRMKQTRHGLHYEALCDLCREPMDVTEPFAYVTAPTPKQVKALEDSGMAISDPHAENGGDIVCHFKCYRTRVIPGWSTMTTFDTLLEKLLLRHRNRNPALTAFIKELNDRRSQTDPQT